MDDFNVSSLHESKNEWGARLITILTPLIIDGYKSILEEAIKLCKDNGEMDKYLMTFQNFISRIPKWNSTIIETERKRICEKSGCSYLEDLVSCVHVIQLKILTSMRVGQKQKKIDINIPKLDDFIHKIYVNVARKIYKNVYLIEIIVQECILNTLRESIPVEAILKAYMDETVEEDVTEEIKEQIIEEPIRNHVQVPNNTNTVANHTMNTIANNRLSFSDTDYVSNENGNIVPVVVPKTIENLEKISNMRAEQRKLDESNDDDDNDNERLTISSESISLDSMDIHVIDEPKLELFPDLMIDAEVLY